MVFLSFIFIFTGLCIFTAGVLLSTLHMVGTGKWPGFRPGRWEGRLKKLFILTGAGFLLTTLGVLAGYGI